MHLENALTKVFYAFEKVIGERIRDSDRQAIKAWLRKQLNESGQKQEFNIDDAEETLAVISEIFGYKFSLLEKKDLPKFVNNLGSQLAEFAKTRYEKCQYKEPLQEIAHLIFLLFVFGYLNTEKTARQARINSFIAGLREPILGT